MGKGFFDLANEHVASLSESELRIFDYLVKNVAAVREMSIRQFAKACYVSTATVFRFTQKLGFSGYAEMIDALEESEGQTQSKLLPDVLWRKNYREEYLKNVTETVRVISEEQVAEFSAMLDEDPVIYCFAEGLDAKVLEYAAHVFTVYGLRTVLLRGQHEIDAALPRIGKKDILLCLSFSGKSPGVIALVEEVVRRKTAKVVTITRAGNNIIQNLSDLNFYVFSDEMHMQGEDITSRVSMIAILELLLYHRIGPEDA